MFSILHHLGGLHNIRDGLVILILSVLILTGAVAGYLAYSYFNPTITITYAHPSEPTDNYTEHISFEFQEKFGFNVPASVSKKFNEFTDRTSEVFSDLAKNYIAPTHVIPSFKEEDGKTIVTFSGTATAKLDNVTSEYKKEVVFDFILSRDLEDTRDD